MTRNVFVLGLDGLNLESLQSMPDADRYRFHQLLTIEELQQGEEIPFQDLIAKAEEQLRDFDGTVDAIVGYWDFPISSMVPILAERFGVRSAPLESVLKCEHKYWSRLEQREVIDEVPRFAAVDPFDEESVRRLDVPYPYWLKPVKSFSSDLAFQISDDEDLEAALPEIREGIGRVGEPFDWVLSMVDLPPEIAELGAEICIAEEDVFGHQATVEGFHNGDVHVHGIIDSVAYEDTPSFERFQYPSRLPWSTQQRMVDVSERLIAHLGLRPSTFNIEFFWDADRDLIHVLEVNPRHSQSHAKLFQYVDGVPNHQLMVELGLGERPTLPWREGDYEMAAKWFLRRFSDGVVTRSATPDEVRAVEDKVPGTTIDVLVEEGDRLSETPDQDSYSFKVANVYVGADSDEELRAKSERCAELLPLEFEDPAD